MLSSQRALFDIPRDVCFLNAASWSPLPLATQEAGRKAVARKGRPWLIGWLKFRSTGLTRKIKKSWPLLNTSGIPNLIAATSNALLRPPAGKSRSATSCCCWKSVAPPLKRLTRPLIYLNRRPAGCKPGK